MYKSLLKVNKHIQAAENHAKKKEMENTENMTSGCAKGSQMHFIHAD